MATGTPIDKPYRRHPGITRHIGAVLPVITRTAFRAAGPAAAQLVADWAVIVGPSLAAVSTPRRLSAGTLTLGCSGPVAMELQHLSSQLIERINTHLGKATVQRVRLVQEAVPRRVGPVAPVVAAKPLALPVIEGLPDGPLRDALARLGARIVKRG